MSKWASNGVSLTEIQVYELVFSRNHITEIITLLQHMDSYMLSSHLLLYITTGLQHWGVVFFCRNALCHLFCRFHYASKKKTSARPRAQMFSRSNYPLNYPLKATERAQSSASSRPELLIHHLRGGSKHQEKEWGAGKTKNKMLMGFLMLRFPLSDGKAVLCHIFMLI